MFAREIANHFLLLRQFDESSLNKLLFALKFHFVGFDYDIKIPHKNCCSVSV